MKYLIITTINSADSGSFEKLRNPLSGWKIVVVGDKKTPSGWSYPGIKFISVEEQIDGFKGSASLIYER